MCGLVSVLVYTAASSLPPSLPAGPLESGNLFLLPPVLGLSLPQHPTLFRGESLLIVATCVCCGGCGLSIWLELLQLPVLTVRAHTQLS